ncbi:MAG: RidA family protein [Bryobacteraceae bacterium]
MMRRCLLRSTVALTLVGILGSTAWAGHKKKEDEPKPQVLPLPKELPRALSAETQSLSFRVTPLLKTGHLSSQIHDTLSGLIRDVRGGTIVKLRAFVAGVGDSRRVDEMVGDMFTDRKLPLPVLTIVQVGALGDDAAAVVMEAVVSERKQVNPGGLAFLAGQTGSSLDEALAKIGANAKSVGLTSDDVLRATCFTDRLTDYAAGQKAMNTAFPQASINLMQALRDPANSESTCEAVARLSPGSAHAESNDPRVAFVTEPHIVFTGLQLSFGTYLDDADSALSHLQRDVEAVHADIRNTVSINAFSLDPAAVSALEKTMPKFKLPANTLTVQPVEGLPSLDAALGMEAILAPAGTSSASTSSIGVRASTRP